MDELIASLQRALGLFADNPRYYEGELPSATDSAVADLIVQFTRAQARERELLIAAVPKKLSGYFLSFAVRMATLGVRERSEDRILHGLVALAIEDFRTDWREDLMTMAPLNDAAVRIGADPIALFDRAASFASAATAEKVKAFVRRQPELKDIKVMGFSAEEMPDGFAYVFRWPRVPRARKS